MKKEDETLEKLLTIERAVNEMATLRQGILELKEGEAQRQKVMEELRASEDRYKVLIETIPQKLFMKDKNSVYVFCNQSYARDLKIKPEEISGRTDYEFFSQELAEKYQSDDKRVLTTGRPEDIEEKYVQDGQSFIVHTVKVPVKDVRGDTVGLLGIFWDITEQKRNEEGLRKNCVQLEEAVSSSRAELQTANKQLQEEMAGRRRIEGRLYENEEEFRKSRAQLEEGVSSSRAELQAANKQLQEEMAERRRVEGRLCEAEGMFRAVFENFPTPSVMLEENMVIFLINKEFEKLSGYSQEEVEGKKSWTEFFTPDELEKMKDYDLVPSMKPGVVPRSYEYRFLHKKGNIRDVTIATTAIPGTKRSVTFLLDITDRKQAEDELRTSLEPFRGLVNTMEKFLIALNREKSN